MEASNVYWGYLRNELNWGIATYGENPMAGQFLDFALKTRWADSFLPYAGPGGQGAGGVPQEGSQYGRYMLQYPLIPFATAAQMGRQLYDETPFFKAAVFYL